MTGRDDIRVIEAIELTTRRRGRRALEAVSFQVRPGQVTGLLGPPGAGKTGVLRRMVQLDRGGGRTLYDGRVFRALGYPMRSVGVLLDPLAVHPGRTVGGHLRLALAADPEAATAGRRERIEAVLDVVGLTEQARTRIFELTEGMTVRLGLAQALLGDPQALLLDEPDQGLEPEGRPWLAALLRAYAAQGRCVLVTGQNTDAMLGYADRILVLDGGKLVGQRTARQAARELAGDCVIVRTPQVLRLAAILVAAGAEPTQLDGVCLEVRGLDRARIGDLAFRNEVPLHELSVRSPGEDPVVAVLEVCRKPPTVVPVQTPAVTRPAEHHGQHHGQTQGQTQGQMQRAGNVRVQARPQVAEETQVLSAVRMPFEGELAPPTRSTDEAERAGNALAADASTSSVDAPTSTVDGDASVADPDTSTVHADAPAVDVYGANEYGEDSALLRVSARPFVGTDTAEPDEPSVPAPSPLPESALVPAPESAP